MPLHKTKSQDLPIGEVMCFMCGSPGNERVNPLKLEKKRYVVISCQLSDEGPHSFTMDFYKSVSKYEKQNIHHRQLMEVEPFCGFIKGSIKKNMNDKYIALIFTSFTIMMTLSGKVGDIDTRTEKCSQLFKDHFGHVMTRSIKFDKYPEAATRIFQREQSGRVLLSASKTRLSLCSETYHHECLYSWHYEDITVPEIPDHILLLIVSETADGCGEYKFTSGHSEKIRTRLLQKGVNTGSENVYEPPPSFYLPSETSARGHPSPPSFWSTLVPHPPPLRRPSQESSQSAPLLQTTTEFRRKLSRVSMSGSIWSETSIPESYVSQDEWNDEIYMTTCGMCNDSYADYINQEQVASLSNSLTSLASFQSDKLPEEITDDGGFDLNEYVHEKCQDIITLIERQRSSRLTCASGSANTSSGNSLEPSPQSSDNAEMLEPRRKISVPCAGIYRLNTRSLVFSETFSADSSTCAPSSTMEIFKTMDRVLRGKPPSRDTLNIGHSLRCQICMRLYLPSCNTAGTFLEDWQLLGEAIGLCFDAINLISTIVRNHFLPYPAAEVVLRHWQYVYNKYGPTDEDGKCPYACNQLNLVNILRDMNRHDLVELLITGAVPPRLRRLDTF